MFSIQRYKYFASLLREKTVYMQKKKKKKAWNTLLSHKILLSVSLHRTSNETGNRFAPTWLTIPRWGFGILIEVRWFVSILWIGRQYDWFFIFKRGGCGSHSSNRKNLVTDAVSACHRVFSTVKNKLDASPPSNFSNRLSIFDNKIDSSYIFSIPLYWFRLICIEDWIRICQEFFIIKYPLIIIGENNGIFLYYLYYILLYLIISCN